MKSVIDDIALILLAAGMIVAALVVKDCIRTEDHEAVTIAVPSDSSFAPVVHRGYRPPSTPFERPSKVPVRLPKNVQEKEIARIVIVAKMLADSLGRRRMDTTALIETKRGDLFVDKQEGRVSSVEVIDYLPPILAFDLVGHLGLSLGLGRELTPSPLVGLSFISLYDHIQLPVVFGDVKGLGLEVCARVKEFSFGAGVRWSFNGLNKDLVVTIDFNI